MKFCSINIFIRKVKFVRKEGRCAMNPTNSNSEEFSVFDNKDKGELKKALDSAAMDFMELAFISSEDVPEISEDEINGAVEKIIERVYPSELKTVQDKEHKKVKQIFKVLSGAAVFVFICLASLYAVGANYDISMENGFFTFAEDTVKATFSGEKTQNNITTDLLLTDLASHGFDEILLPSDFTVNPGDYKVSAPEYHNDSSGRDVTFRISNSKNRFVFTIRKIDSSEHAASYEEHEGVKTLVLGDIRIYVFESDGLSFIELCHKGFSYRISSEISVSDMVKIAESIK